MNTGPTAATEELHLRTAESRLTAEFPAVDEELIHALMIRALQQLSDAKIRAYIPLLAAKEVRTSLRRNGE